jgi:cob(I)alamin adenosyltransferase
MKIYTKRGDTGETDLFGGARVLKCHVRVKVYGAVDAANVSIGSALNGAGLPQKLREELVKIMGYLFCAGAELATAPKDSAQQILKKHLKNHLQEAHVTWLEESIDEMENSLKPLTNFILPSGVEAAVRLHQARVLVRHAEVLIVELVATSEPVRPEIVRFFNRLSDYLFVASRFCNQVAGVEEIGWSGALS